MSTNTSNTPGFYKRSRPRPDGTVGYSGYDHAETLAAAVQAYKRTRTLKYFILVDGSPDLAELTCTCGHKLSEGDDGNRCQLIKRNGKFYVLGQHYRCSWDNLLGALCTSSTVAEAGRKLTKAEAGGWKAVA